MFGCFLFQAEDGIRDTSVTGVQTCALPISVDASVTRPRTLPANCATSVAGANSIKATAHTRARARQGDILSISLFGGGIQPTIVLATTARHPPLAWRVPEKERGSK